jgi:endonuclease/exonuclease/phosphatase family metal-dependent hydrolase
MTLKLMTWNVENLFRPKADENTDAYDAKLKNLADTIKELAPDVLALQEVGDEGALEDLGDELDLAYPHVATGAPGDRGIRVAILSKLPLVEPQSIVDFAPNPSLRVANDEGEEITTMRRGALWVKIKPDNMVIHVIAVHLKSKLLEFPNGFSTKDEGLRARTATRGAAVRTMEAYTLRVKANDIITKNQTQGLVILGDFNDVPEAASNQLLQGPDGSVPGQGKGFDQPDDGDDVRLFNLAKLIPEERRYSRINNGVKELIDQMFVSEELVPWEGPDKKKRKRPVVDSRPDLQGGIPSIGSNPHERKNEPASDHAPVIATFDL